VKIASIVLACSTLASVAACTVREESPRGTVVREHRSCGRHEHWNGRYCVEDRRDTTVIIDTRR